MKLRRIFPAFLGAALLALASPAASDATLAEGITPGMKTPVPTAKEWVTATDVKLTRTSPAAKGCTARAVREWIRVRCPLKTFAISLLGGSNEGLSFWIATSEPDQPGEVQFPLRVGDRRVVQLWVQGEGKDAAPRPSVVLQEQWLEGEPAPRISVL